MKERKGAVLKYSYRLPCDVDRGSTGTDNTAVDSIFEFKEPARGLGWTCPHILSLSLSFLSNATLSKSLTCECPRWFFDCWSKWWKVVINFIFITISIDSSLECSRGNYVKLWSFFRGMFCRQMELVRFIENSKFPCVCIFFKIFPLFFSNNQFMAITRHCNLINSMRGIWFKWMILISVIFTSTREYESTPSLPRLTSNLATTSNEIHATRRPWWIESTAFEILNSVLTCANYHGRLFCITERKREKVEGEESVTVFNKSRSSFLLLTINVFSLLQILSRSLEMIRSRKPSINCVPFEKR